MQINEIITINLGIRQYNLGIVSMNKRNQGIHAFTGSSPSSSHEKSFLSLDIRYSSDFRCAKNHTCKCIYEIPARKSFDILGVFLKIICKEVKNVVGFCQQFYLTIPLYNQIVYIVF